MTLVQGETVLFAAGDHAALAFPAAEVVRVYNSTTGGEFRRPSRQAIREFEETVAAAGAHVTVRVERGAKSVAACGQLRTRAKHPDS